MSKPNETKGPLSLVSQLISYEQGELDETETLQLFQQLVNTGLAWQLQGHYGRQAKAFLDAGLIRPKG